MTFGGLLARAGLAGTGLSVMTGAIVLTFSESADAANCCKVAVKALGISRVANGPSVHAPSGPLAFTGVSGLGSALVLGAVLICAGALLFRLARRHARRRSRTAMLVATACAAVVGLLGTHSADAAVPAAATANCCPAPVKVGATTTVATATTPTTTTTGTGTSGTGTTTGVGTTGSGGPGTPPDPGTTVTAAPALPDATEPLVLVLGAGLLGAGALMVRRRRGSYVS